MRILLIILLTALLINSAFSQRDGKKEDLPVFNLDVLNFYSPDSTKSRLDVYVEVPFSRLEFKKIKGENKFSANFDLTIEIKNSENVQVFSKVYKENITTKKSDIEYLASNSSIIIKNIFLQPGKYKLTASIYEYSTKNVFESEKDFTMKDFMASPVSLSDVMIVSKVTYDKDRKQLTPDVSRNISDLDTFYIFFFVYKNSEDEKIDVTYKISDSKDNIIYSGIDMLDNTSGLDNINQMLIPVSLNNLSFDKYKIEVNAAGSQTSASTSSELVSESSDFPMSLDNIDELISQLQYIANETEMKKMENAKTAGDKQKRFVEFWKSKDPSPNTKRNEAMVEYYKRLRYADKHFSTVYAKGWKSDMGMVYVIFGMPGNIERHPYEMDSKPYEVWDYYDINRQFVFVDNTGFGDFRLVTPIWDTFRYQR
jgi:GWxTD domain-containing protein